jgi:peptidyl-prolyl cis-trans isomerase A (cyclophilin A)
MTRLLMTLATLALCINLFAEEPASAPAEKANPLFPKAQMATSLGEIVLELNGEKAPISTLNFIQYAEEGYYDGTIFHRVMDTFMIQGGGMDKNLDEKKGAKRPGIKNEFKNGLKNMRGTIAMARLGGQPDSATTQFFINVVDNASLDQPRDGAAYAVFGKVVEGMDVVDKIRNTPVSGHPKYGGGAQEVVPVETVEILSVKPVGAWDKKAIEAQIAEAEKLKEKQMDAVIAKWEGETGKKFTQTSSGLKILHVTEGTGTSPKPTDKVEVHYRGTLVDGSQFDSSYDRGQSIEFPLNGVIAGWTEGVGLMKPGGKTILIIPPDLGYGSRDMGPSLPANSTLVFEVELLAIK